MTRRALASFLLSHVVPSPGHLAGPATVLGWAMDPRPRVWVRAAQPGCAVSLSLPEICSVIVIDVQCQCHCLGFAVRLLLLQPPPRIPKNKGCFAKHCPTPCCLHPRTEGIQAFPKSGTRMISGKNLGPALADLALPQRALGEGGILCPNRAVLRGLELHSAWWCHLHVPPGLRDWPSVHLMLGIALGLCPSVVLWLWQELTPDTDLPWCHTQVGSV